MACHMIFKLQHLNIALLNFTSTIVMLVHFISTYVSILLFCLLWQVSYWDLITFSSSVAGWPCKDEPDLHYVPQTGFPLSFRFCKVRMIITLVMDMPLILYIYKECIYYIYIYVHVFKYIYIYILKLFFIFK